MKNKKKIIIISSILVAVILLAVGTSYALFRYNITQNTNFKVKSGTLELEILDNYDGNIVLNNLVPTKDSVALSSNSNVYNFTLTNTGTIDSSFSIYLDDVILENESKERLSNSLVKANLRNNTNGESKTITLSDDRVISTGYLLAGYSSNFTLKLWLDYSAGNDAQDKYYAIKLRVDGTQFNAPLGLKDMVLTKNTILTGASLDTSSNISSDVNGLYVSYDTNSGNPTYYFRGNVNNNYVSFAGLIWRIVRINEDGTIRIILDDAIDENLYKINNTTTPYTQMYYSSGITEGDSANPNARYTLENWYDAIIGSNEEYSSKIATGNYFCEAAKVVYSTSQKNSSATNFMKVFSDYTATFKCEEDGNGNRYVLDSNEEGVKIGLITYDEVVHAGGYPSKANNTFYLYKDYQWWTMSPAGLSSNIANTWRVHNNGGLGNPSVATAVRLRPVINLRSDVVASGFGYVGNKYIIK